MFLGDAILVPVSEVGSVASAAGWLAACAAYFAMRPSGGQKAVALLGVFVGLMMIVMKVSPVIPGHFNTAEWIALAIWIAIGVVLGLRARAQVSSE
jgi:hypothetical protein